MKKANHYSIFIIGSQFYRMKQAVYFPTADSVPSFEQVDLILIGTPIDWKEDGRYSIENIQKEIRVLYAKGYSHQVCVSRFMPLRETEQLGCHYFPLEFIEKEQRVLCFGLNPSISFDADLLRSLFLDVFRSRVKMMSLKRLEVLVLAQTTRTIVEKTLVHEMESFYHIFQTEDGCFFNGEEITQEEVSVLTYFIRKCEDHYIECPILYSSLFRQKCLANK